MKPSFLTYTKPILTTMIQTREPKNGYETMKRAIKEGTEAFGFQACRLKPEFRTQEIFRRFTENAEGRPVYATNYRYGYNEGLSDDELAEGILQLADAGVTLCDVMGDMFCKDPDELTMDEVAVKKQMELVRQLHEKGTEVLMSSHTYAFRSAERVLEIALEQQKRGADIVKIVTGADNMEQQLENLRITRMLKQELKVPFLFLSVGECGLHRRIGPMLGSCMWLCVQEYDELSTPAQPLLRNIKAIRENF